MDWLGLKTFLIDNYAFFGLAGSLLIVITMLSAGWVYRGKQDEKYSVFNHFISELGEMGVSKAAPAFNWGLILSGLILIPFVVGMGM
jgi:hypothetical membrane protein